MLVEADDRLEAIEKYLQDKKQVI